MGFFDKVFGSDKGDEPKKSSGDDGSFTPIIVNTDNVAQTLHDTALKYKISSSTLDIRLLSFKTFIKMSPKEEEWTEVEDGEWEKLNKPEILLSPDFQIKQSYEIEIFQLRYGHRRSDGESSCAGAVYTSRRSLFRCLRMFRFAKTRQRRADPPLQEQNRGGAGG